MIFATAISGDGRYLATMLIPGGAEDNAEIHVFDLHTNRDTGDVVSGWFPSWLPDNRSLLYVSPANRRFRFEPLHAMGSSSARDRAVFGPGVVP